MAFVYSRRLRRWMVGPARIRLCGGGAVEGGLQPRRERTVGRGVRPRAARRRHRLRAQLLEDLLPDLRVRADVLDVDAVEGEVSGQQTLVVAGDAVAVQHGPPGGGVGCHRFDARLTHSAPAEPPDVARNLCDSLFRRCTGRKPKRFPTPSPARARRTHLVFIWLGPTVPATSVAKSPRRAPSARFRNGIVLPFFLLHGSHAVIKFDHTV